MCICTDTLYVHLYVFIYVSLLCICTCICTLAYNRYLMSVNLNIRTLVLIIRWYKRMFRNVILLFPKIRNGPHAYGDLGVHVILR